MALLYIYSPMKFWITALFTLYLFSIAAAQTAFKNTFTIKGFLPAWNGALVLLKIEGQTVQLDTVKNDMFSIIKSTEATHAGTLEIRKGTTALFVPLYIEPGTIRIRDKGNRTLEAFGTKTNDAFLQLNALFDSAALQQQSSVLEAKKIKKNLAAAYIKNNPQSLISLQLLNDYFYLDKESDTTYTALFASLDRAIQQTPLGQKIGHDATVHFNTQLGRKAPNLVLRDTAFSKASLYQSGQITLIDFWASWCRPCRIENRGLKTVFEKYKDKGFTITSVSLDNNMKLWKDAIKKDNLTWQQRSDLKGWESEAAKLFGISAIPMNILVDGNGTVIAKNLSSYSLEKQLEQLLQKSF